MGRQASWVATRLQKNDTLDLLVSFYKPLQARDIVEGNGVPWRSSSIEGDGGWIQKSGSKTKIGSRWVFDANTVIFLPPGGPRAPVEPSTVITPGGPGKPLPGLIKSAGFSGWLGAAVLGVLALVGFGAAAAKKRRKKGGAA